MRDAPETAQTLQRRDLRLRGNLAQPYVDWLPRPETPFSGSRRRALTRLDQGKKRVRKLLQELSKGRGVHLWWWERTGPSELTLFLLAGPENERFSLVLAESAVVACATDDTARSEIRKQLVELLESIP